MKVVLDLRPRALVEQQQKRFSFARLFMLLFLLSFILLGGTTLVRSFLMYRSLQADIWRLEDSVALLRMQNNRMTNELKRLADEEALYVSALKLLQDELPALEFVRAMENSLPRGVWMRSISITPGRVSLQGSSYSENDVVEFAKGLLDWPVVATVDFPETTRVQRDNQSIVDFSLSCRLRDFSATMPPASPEEGEVVRQ